MKKLKRPYTVYTFEDYKPNKKSGLPKGSAILVEYISKYEYKGLWSSELGTYQVTIPKAITERG